MIQGLEQRGVDPVRLQLMRHAAEEFRQTFARIGNLLDTIDHLAFAVVLPAFQRRIEQRLAGAEMPVETALRHAELACKRFDGERANTLFGDQVKCGKFPVLRGQASAFRLCGYIHSRMVAIRQEFVMYGCLSI